MEEPHRGEAILGRGLPLPGLRPPSRTGGCSIHAFCLHAFIQCMPHIAEPAEHERAKSCSRAFAILGVFGFSSLRCCTCSSFLEGRQRLSRLRKCGCPILGKWVSTLFWSLAQSYDLQTAVCVCVCVCACVCVCVCVSERGRLPPFSGEDVMSSEDKSELAAASTCVSAGVSNGVRLLKNRRGLSGATRADMDRASPKKSVPETKSK